jgi:hypothetical protein
LHLQGSTNALSNFRNGALDNYYPLATVHMDASPATTAASSLADTGPAGGFLDSEANGKLPQTQYALASSPGPAHGAVSQTGTIAVADATPTSADARTAVASSTAGGAQATPEPGSPEADGGAAHVSFDAATGVARAAAVGTLSHASFGGVLAIDGLTVTAAVVVTTTKATPAYSITAASIKVAGVPVAVTDHGITLASPSAALTAAGAQLVAQLNGALKTAGISISTIAPSVTVTGPNATIDATGIVVTFTAPNPNPAIPSLSSKIVLGEARAFAFVTPGGPVTPAVTAPVVVAPVVVAPSTPVAVVVPTTSGSAGSNGSTGVGTAPPVSAGGPVASAAPTFRLITSHRRPTDLVLLYFAWQTLILASVAAVIWWRLGLRAGVE